MLSVSDLGPGILCIVSHADDGAMVFGGTLRRDIESGAHVTLVVVTDSAGDSGEDQSEQRRQEELLACKITGIGSVRFLEGYPDGHLADHTDRLTDELAGIITELGPTAVLTFDPANGLTGHHDHRSCGRCVELAMAKAESHAPLLLAALTQQWHDEV